MPYHGHDGQGMVEYGLILALVAIMVIGAIGVYGGGVSGSLVDSLEQIRDALQ